MKNGNIKKSKEINKTKNHIQRIFPHANKVNVSLKKCTGNTYKSIISVLVPPKRELVALKHDPCPKKSLEKAQQAIVKQIHRVKTQRLRTQLKFPDFFKHSA